MTRIAFIPLTPLGDSILLMGELEELKRLYSPCDITVLAIPLIAELFRNFAPCDRVVELNGGIHGPVALPVGFDETFDIVFNHGYEPWYDDIVRKLKRQGGEAYGMEETYRPAPECEKLFDKWVPLDYWKNVTLKRWPLVPNQFAELIRLVNPDYAGGPPSLSFENFRCEPPENAPIGDYVLFLPGTSASWKVYPMAKVLSLATAIQSLGFGVVFALGPQDAEIKAALKGKKMSFFSDLPLAKLAWLITRARLVVGNDSGPMHLAASFDVPTIHFFSFSGAYSWFCYDRRKHRLLMPECGRRDGLNCGECARTCIGKIPVSAAVQETCGLLGATSPTIARIAYFAQDLIGDALTWTNIPMAFAAMYAPCEITVFCNSGLGELFKCMAFCDRAVPYDSTVPWSREEAATFGHFDIVVNTRYDADSVERVRALSHDAAYGFENIEIPEDICRRIYDGYVPFSIWDNVRLRRETSVTEQGAELVRLLDSGYHCEMVSFGKTDFVRELPEDVGHPRVVFVIGANDASKSWGLERFLEVARFVRGHGFTPLFLLGPKERELEPCIRAAGFEANACLPFRIIAGLFDPDFGTACVIGNDTGLMHLACALGAPSVTIMPFGSQFTWFPYGKDGRTRHICLAPSCSCVMCASRCGELSACVQKVAVEDAFQVVARLVGIDFSTMDFPVDSRHPPGSEHV